MSNRKSIDASPRRTDFLEFIRQSVGSQFVVPVYQRNYTWTANREVAKFLDDYKDLLKGKKERHFMGILMYLEKNIHFSFREHSIIDGQQRLITVFLMILAIRDVAYKNEEILAKRIESFYLTNQHLDEKQKFKLKPLVSDDNVFSKLIENNLDAITKEEKEKSNVFMNYSLIKNTVLELMKSYALESLLNMIENFYIIVIPLIDEDNAQQIFESINSTGARLLSSDLIRNFMLMNLDSDTQDYLYKKYWHELEKNIKDNDKIEEFFRIYLSIKKYQFFSKKDIYEEFKIWFKENLQTAELVLKDILDYSNIFKKFIINEKAAELEFIIEDYRIYDSNLPLPFLIELIKRYNNEEISIVNLRKVNSLISSYLVRRSLTSQNAKTISRLFPALLKNVLSLVKKDFSDVFEISINFLVNNNKLKSSFMPDNKELTSSLLNGNAYVLQITRSIFNRIELSDNSAPVNLDILSVEHIMPQTKTNYWLTKILPKPEDDYEKIVNLIGNLTLSSKLDNSKMQNFEWEEKKKILRKTSHLKLNHEILSLKEWNYNEIYNRSVAIIDKIIDLFPYHSNVDNQINKKEVFINKPGYKVKAFIYDSGIVEISKDSFFKKHFQPHPEDSRIDDIYRNLKEEGFIKEDLNEAFFTDSYNFTNIEVVTSLIMRDKALIHEWLDNDGLPAF
jgi:uncharacterized protein with ParB-like and HNH nuclease domain